jgi:DNA-binding beta-propeller fold protein YncE
VYLAPVVERDGAYALRVFIVCFDAATVFVYDPETEQVENVLRVGLGPFAMAFDPFDMTDVATHAQVPFDPRTAGTGLRRYRFAYLASFTNSFVQVIDLDDAQVDRSTFERIVFTLGRPMTPKGS